MLITQFWDHEDVPADVQPLIGSWKELNPECEHRLFDRSRAIDFVAKHFSSREVKALESCAVPAMQADYFRYCALLVDGGWYVDADSECLQNVAPLIPTADYEGLLLKRESWGPVINGYMWFRAPGHPFLKAVLETVTTSVEQRISNSVWTAVGALHLSLLTFLELNEHDTLADWKAHLGPEEESVLDICTRVVSSGRYRGCLNNVSFIRVDQTNAYWNDGAPVQYKTTPRDWRKWPGSIYA